MAKEITKIKRSGEIYEVKDKAARDRVTALETKVDEIEDNYVDKSTLENLNLEGYVKTEDLAGYVTTGQLSGVQSSVSSLITDVTTNATNIRSLQAQVTTLQGLQDGSQSFVTDQALADTLTGYATYDQLTTAIGNLERFAEDSEVENVAATTLASAKQYTDDKLATIELPSPEEAKQSYETLTDVSLDSIMTPGFYKITGATDTPSTNEEAGYLDVSEFADGTIKQMWHTNNYDALRICEDGTTAVNITVNDLATGEIPNKLYTITDEGVFLTAGRSYTISGHIKGKLVVNKLYDTVNTSLEVAPIEKTVVVLDGLTITNTQAPGIMYDPENKSLVLVLKENKYNFVVIKGEAGELTSDAAIYSNNNLDIKGVGYLTVYTNTGCHAINGSEIEISGKPHVWLHALHDGIHGRKYTEIQEGYFYFDYVKDGIGSGDTGTFDIYSGTFEFNDILDTCFDSKPQNLVSEIQGLKTTIRCLKTPGNGLVNDPNRVRILETVNLTGAAYSLISKSAWFGPVKVLKVSKIDGSNGAPDSYNEIADLTSEAAVYNAETGVYTLPISSAGKFYYMVEGYLQNKQLRFYSEGITPSVPTELVLNRAYIESNTIRPGVTYDATGKSLNLEAYEPSYIVNTSNVENNRAVYSAENTTIKGDSVVYFSAPNGVAVFSSNLTIRGDGLRYAYDSTIGFQGTFVYLGADDGDVNDPAVTPGNSTQFIYALNNTTDFKARLNTAGTKKGAFIIYQYQKGDIVVGSIESTNINGDEAIAANMGGTLYYKTRTYNNIGTHPDAIVASNRAKQYAEAKNYEANLPDVKTGVWYQNFSQFTDTEVVTAPLLAEIQQLKTQLSYLTPKEVTFTNYGDNSTPIYDQDETLGDGLIGKILCYRFACPEVIDDKMVNVKSMAKDGKKIYARDGDYGYPATDGTGQLNFSYEWNIASFPNGEIPSDLVVVPEITPIHLTTSDKEYPGYSSFKSQYATAIPGMYRITKVTDDLRLTCHVMRESEMPAHTITYRLVLPENYEGQVPTVTTYRCGDALEKIFVDGLTREKIQQKGLTQDYDLIEGKVLQFVDGVATDYSYHKDSGLKDLGNITDGTSQIHFVISNVPEGYSCRPALGPNVVVGKKNGCHLSGFEFNSDYNAWEAKKVSADIEIIITLAPPVSVSFVEGAYSYSAAPKNYDSEGHPLDKGGNIIPVSGDNATTAAAGSDYKFDIYYDSLRRNWSGVLTKEYGTLELDTPYELDTVGGSKHNFIANSTDPNNATEAKIFITAQEALETIESIVIDGSPIDKSQCLVSCSGKKASITIPGNLVTGNIVITSVASARANEPASRYAEK